MGGKEESMNHHLKIRRAMRHGWKVSGVAYLGSVSYPTLAHPNTRLHIAVHPLTDRVECLWSVNPRR